MRKALTETLVAMVRFYQQALHVLVGYGNCRFSPTCSEYMVQALRTHGPVYFVTALLRPYKAFGH